MRIPNPPLRKRHKRIFFPLAAAPFVIILIDGLMKGSQWWLDACFALIMLGMLFALNRWLRVGITGFWLIVAGLILHNIGAYGAYGLVWGPFGYDNIVHLFSGIIAGYVAYNFVARRLHVKDHKTKKRTVVDDHAAMLIILVIALVALLGLFVELLEFGGYMFLGPGEGMFFEGSGDSEIQFGIDGNYVDTMTDIIANTLGSIIGVLCYWLFTYRFTPWVKYET